MDHQGKTNFDRLNWSQGHCKTVLGGLRLRREAWKEWDKNGRGRNLGRDWTWGVVDLGLWGFMFGFLGQIACWWKLEFLRK